MEYYQRINTKFNKGLVHGTQGVYSPGLITGTFRRAYLIGHKKGSTMKQQVRTLTDFKK